MECPDKLPERIEPTELVDAIKSCRDALAQDHDTQPTQTRLANLRTVAMKLCRAFCKLEGASDFWFNLELTVRKRDTSQKLDIKEFGKALKTLSQSNYKDLSDALKRWGFTPQNDAMVFVEQQMGQLCGAVLASPVVLDGRTLGSLPAHAKAAVKVMREQVCGGEANFKTLADREILKGGATKSALGALWGILKAKLGGLVGIAMIFASVEEGVFYEATEESVEQNLTLDAYLLLGMLCTIHATELSYVYAENRLA